MLKIYKIIVITKEQLIQHCTCMYLQSPQCFILSSLLIMKERMLLLEVWVQTEDHFALPPYTCTRSLINLFWGHLGGASPSGEWCGDDRHILGQTKYMIYFLKWGWTYTDLALGKVCVIHMYMQTWHLVGNFICIYL